MTPATVTATIPTAEATSVAEAFAELLSGRCDIPLSDGFFARDWSPLWTELSDGGWLEAGREIAASALVELVPLAEVWGRHLVPLPFSEGCVSALAGEPDTATGIADRDGEVWAAFADRFTGRPGTGVADEFAPSRRFARYPAGTPGVRADPTGGLVMLWAAESVGCAATVLHRSVEYAGQRRAYGRLIGSFQVIRHLLADMYRDLELARSAVLWAAADEPARVRAATHSLELARTVIEGGIQVHGGMGFTWESGLHFPLRHVMVLEKLVRMR